jgi:hypothetical protein
MADGRILSTWKEIASYLKRGVRTVQRWETGYMLPVRRSSPDAQSVFAFADEVDAWLERAKPRQHAAVRPTFLVIDVFTPNALSDLKLALEAAKFNVLTAFSTTETFSTAARYDVDGFVIDGVVLDEHPSKLSEQLRRLYPSKTQVFVGDDVVETADVVIASGHSSGVVEWLIGKFGQPFPG